MSSFRDSLKAYFDFYYDDSRLSVGSGKKYMPSRGCDALVHSGADDSGLWKYLINSTEHSRALEIGAGSNSHIHHLADTEVHCTQLDTMPARLDESRLKHSTLNQGKELNYLLADDIPAGFSKHPKFDILLIGLPSVKRKMLDGQGQKAYQYLLRECHKILSPSGVIVVFSNNRYSYKKLQIQNFLSTNDGSRGSHLRRLKAAGFHNTECYSPRISGDHVEGYRATSKTDGTPSQLPLAPAVNWKQRLKESTLAPRYIFTSNTTSSSPRQTLLDALMEEIQTHLARRFGESRLEITESFITRKKKLVLQASWRAQELIVKIPQNNTALLSENNNFLILKSTSERMPDNTVPSPIAKGTVRGQTYFVESLLPGYGLSDVSNAKNRDLFLPGIFNLLEKFYSLDQAQDSKYTAVLSGALYEKLVKRKIARVALATKSKQLIDKLEHYFSNELEGKILPMGLLHGDFSVSNIWTNREAVTGIIDWETGDLDNICALDAINYLDSSLRLHNPGMLINQTIPHLANRELLTAGENQFIDDCYRMYNLESSIHAPLVYLRWLYHINYLLEFWLGSNIGAQEKYIHEIAETLP